MTPAEWEQRRLLDAYVGKETLAIWPRLGQFVGDMPLAALNPSALQIESSDEAVRGWGVAGEGGGFIWLQDFALEGEPFRRGSSR